PIGGVMASEEMVIPNAVGVDIGCGMCAVKTSLTTISKEKLKVVLGGIRSNTPLRGTIPVGFQHHKASQDQDLMPDRGVVSKVKNSQIMHLFQAGMKQLGTLGGGNHFIEIQKGDDGHIWIMIHSGSRNFGFKTAKEYHERAKKLCSRWRSDIPNLDLAFLPMDEGGSEYYKAMNYCLDFAKASRALMMKKSTDIIADITGATVEHSVNIHHNYAAFEHHYGKNVLVHRKGATKATAGLDGIIPGSMGTSSYIVKGLGNPESFMSCSHGAGRRMGRKQAKRTLVLDDELSKMDGIIHGIQSANELDEAPGAYKDIDVVMDNQKDLVDISVKLSPLGVIKG
ncbi:MAG: RtcB family protein, partial [Nitrosomonadaceae bacterium]|nr:RtcB family protein [Nitrosomonadaceae bacterium]